MDSKILLCWVVAIFFTIHGALADTCILIDEYAPASITGKTMAITSNDHKGMFFNMSESMLATGQYLVIEVNITSIGDITEHNINFSIYNHTWDTDLNVPHNRTGMYNDSVDIPLNPVKFNISFYGFPLKLNEAYAWVVYDMNYDSSNRFWINYDSPSATYREPDYSLVATEDNPPNEPSEWYPQTDYNRDVGSDVMFRAWVCNESAPDITPPILTFYNPNQDNTSTFSGILNWNLTCLDSESDLDVVKTKILSTTGYNDFSELILRYNFETLENNNIEDVSLGLNNGTAIEGNLTDTSGNNTGNNALYLDGFNDYVDTNYIWNPRLNEFFSISFWFKPQELSTKNFITSGISNRHRFLYYSGEYIGFFAYNSSNGAIIGMTSIVDSVPLNEWTHMGVIYNTSTAKLYINGVAVVVDNVIESEFKTIVNEFEIGRYTTTYFNMSIDEFVISNSYKESSDMKFIYDYGYADIFNVDTNNINVHQYNYTDSVNIINYDTGSYRFYGFCNDTKNNYAEYEGTFFIDSIFPYSIFTYPNKDNTTNWYIENPFNFNWTFYDDNLIYSINISCNNYTDYISGIDKNIYIYNKTVTINETGLQECQIKYCDAHTNKQIDYWNVKPDYNKDSLTFNDLEIHSLNKLNDISYNKLSDRYTFCFTPDERGEHLVIQLPNYCYYVEKSSYESHFVCNEYWIDFEGQNTWVDRNNRVYIDIKNNKYREPVCFNSIGELNCKHEGIGFNLTINYFSQPLSVDIVFPNQFQVFDESQTNIEFLLNGSNLLYNCSILNNNNVIRTNEFNIGFNNFSFIKVDKPNNYLRVCCRNESATICASIALQHNFSISEILYIFLIIGLLVGIIIFGEITNNLILRFFSVLVTLYISSYFINTKIYVIIIFFAIFLFLRLIGKTIDENE